MARVTREEYNRLRDAHGATKEKNMDLENRVRELETQLEEERIETLTTQQRYNQALGALTLLYTCHAKYVPESLDVVIRGILGIGELKKLEKY